MITMNGGYGKGALWGTFYLPERESSGKAMANANHLGMMTPATDWILPPPGGAWWPVDSSKYGPCLRSVDIGDIISTSKDSQAWNPCLHSTIQGNASFRGLSDTQGPYWSRMVANPRTSYTASIGSKPPIQSRGQLLAAMSGRPCTSSDTRVYGYQGTKVNQNIGASTDEQRYWNFDSTLCANVAPLSVRSSLSQYGPLLTDGEWYGRNSSNTLIAYGSEHNNASWYKVEWDRPDRTTFVRDSICEWHSPASYTPKDSRGESGIDFLVEANHRTTTCKITHVRSDTAGRFYVRYDVTTELSWFGWLFPRSFSGKKTVTVKGLTTSLLILEPGLTTEWLPDLTKANEYCASAKKLAKLLYDPSVAKSARTAAVMDVQALESNWIENLSGLKGTLDVVKPLLDGLKAVKTGDINAARKSLAGGYLAYQYVVAPDISDYHDVMEHGSQILSQATVNRFSKERRRGAAHCANVPVCNTSASLDFYTTYHLTLSNNCFSEIWTALEKLGLDPSAGQIWDCIPFSFVVDWFGRIGESLRRVDQYNSLVLNHDILARIESFKVQWPLEEEVLKYLFDNAVCRGGTPLRYSWYDRRVYHDAGHIDPIAISDNNGLSRSQMAQGAALLTSMK